MSNQEHTLFDDFFSEENALIKEEKKTDKELLSTKDGNVETSNNIVEKNDVAKDELNQIMRSEIAYVNSKSGLSIELPESKQTEESETKTEKNTTKPSLNQAENIEDKKENTPIINNFEIESIPPKSNEDIEEDYTTILPEWNLTDKYYTIGEVAKLFDVNISHIRFWTNEFKIKTRKNKKGDRLYKIPQINQLRNIHYLVKVKKHTIKGARERLNKNAAAISAQVSLKDHLIELRNQLIAIKNNL